MMSRSASTRIALVGAVALLPTGCERPSNDVRAPNAAISSAAIAITRVGVVDVAQGQLLRDQTVIVRDSQIVAVGPAGEVSVPPGAITVEGSGRFLAPGFADMHVHLYTEGDLFTYVANGITTVRNMAGDSTVLRMRRRVSDGAIVGPRIVTAGPVVEASPLSHPDNVPLDDPRRVRDELTRQKTLGYDFVKVYNQLDPVVYDSVVAVASDLGMPVAGHVPVAVGLVRALALRQRSIEHFRGYIGELARSRTPAVRGLSFRDWSVEWERVDTVGIASLVARTVEAGAWNVPTFAFTVHELSPAAEHARLVARPETRYLSLAGLPADRAKAGYLQGFTDADFGATQRGLVMQYRLLRALDAAGAGLLIGTDSWLAGHAFADEAAMFVRAGLTPARVLRAATLDAARFLGEDQRGGTVAVGRRADLVLLDADPLVDIGAVRRVHAVVVGGRLLRRTELDTRLTALGDSLAKSRR